MGLSLSTSFILKIFVLSLLITIETSYSVKAANDKLFFYICLKTSNPMDCLRILKINRTTKRVSSLQKLGLPCVELARFQAGRTADIIKMILRIKKDIPDKGKYEECRQNYMYAEKKISEARNKLRKMDYASARMLMEVAIKVPVSCKKEIGNPPNNAFPSVNEKAKTHFEIALVVLKELEREKAEYMF